MQEKIIEIIVYLLEEFQTGEIATNNYTDLSKELISRGYTENEINLAISWVFNHFQNETQDSVDEIKYSTGSIRVLNEIERMIITPQAYGYLIQLRQLELLTDTDLEFVIERAIAIGSSSVTIEDIKNITVSLLFDSDSTVNMDGFLYHHGSNTVH